MTNTDTLRRYPTNTTKSRLRALGVNVTTRKGVTYLGDGAWGASIRKVRPPAEVPHIANSRSVNHVFFLEISPEGPLRFQAVDVMGEVFDRFELPRRR